MSKGRFGLFNNRIESRRVGNRNLAEHLAIQLDLRLLAAVDELTVADIALAAGGADANNPQPPVVPLLELATDTCVDIGADTCFFRHAILAARLSPVTLDGL